MLDYGTGSGVLAIMVADLCHCFLMIEGLVYWDIFVNSILVYICAHVLIHICIRTHADI